MGGLHEYKVVPAPMRAARVKGVRGTAARLAQTLTGALNELAAEGWEFLRTETLTVEERKGLWGRRQVTQTVMVFRRARQHAQPPAPPVGLTPPGAASPRNGTETRPEPVFRPGALLRAEGGRKYPPLRRTEAADTPVEGG